MWMFPDQHSNMGHLNSLRGKFCDRGIVGDCLRMALLKVGQEQVCVMMCRRW